MATFKEYYSKVEILWPEIEEQMSSDAYDVNVLGNTPNSDWDEGAYKANIDQGYDYCATHCQGMDVDIEDDEAIIRASVQGIGSL